MKVVMPVWATDSLTISVTEDAISSLKGNEIVVVDNGSTFGAGRLRELADLYIRNKENLGYARAVNQGIKLTGFPVAVANNDIRVSPNWVETTNEILEMERIGTIHFRMIPYNEPFKYGDAIWLSGRERWCTGSFFVIAQPTSFDEEYLNSYEDWDLQVRARRAGFRTVYTTKSCYQHLDSYTQKKILETEREIRNQKNREYFKSKFGEYPEDMYLQMFPKQMAEDWRSKFDEL